jgi:histidinol-phosphatase (PHP family)
MNWAMAVVTLQTYPFHCPTAVSPEDIDPERVPSPPRSPHRDAVLTLTPPALDLGGYQDCLRRCRERFPGLRILSGVELSEPHWRHSQAATLLRNGAFDRVLAPVHSTPSGTGFTEISSRLRDRPRLRSYAPTWPKPPR